MSRIEVQSAGRARLRSEVAGIPLQGDLSAARYEYIRQRVYGSHSADSADDKARNSWLITDAGTNGTKPIAGYLVSGECQVHS